MPMETNRGAPTPPIAFGTEPSSVQRRFDVRVVDVDDALLGRLRSACASVVTDNEVAVFSAGTNVTGAVCARCEGFEMEASTVSALEQLIRVIRSGCSGRRK